MTVINTQLREPKLEPADAAPTEPVADIPINRIKPPLKWV